MIFSLTVFNIISAIFLSFLTSWILVEFILAIFRVRSYRFKAFARMLLLFKLPLDICLMNWSNWAISKGVFPAHCEIDSRKLVAICQLPHDMFSFFVPKMGITLYTKDQFSFSLVDILAEILDSFQLHTFIIASICIFALLSIIRLWKIWLDFSSLQTILKDARSCTQKIKNKKILLALKKCNITILTSNAYKGSPFTAGLFRTKIVLSAQWIQSVSSDELEAVIAHEICHCKKKDPFFRLCLTIISILFPWIPTRRLRKMIYFQFELDADSKLQDFDIEKIHLATALGKLANLQFQKEINASRVYLLDSMNVLSRIKALRSDTKKNWNVFHYAILVMAAYFLVGIFLGKFWLI